ncbi:chemotaxis-specific protein-glutamate methyltransferase CheB [Geotalea sp. SG265]|uniref:chemotaxis-specific protein-glutamate methyltransferase CheB n=1 Tax=Geotalea sp. SG265 TaxID=2922867 RepID=UPI001FB03A05|nr:chemotaxis-specific protein-glutamate methyltransferase CheB [Geotalea sp. SG265]
MKDNNSNTIRVLITDDSALAREVIKDIFRLTGDIIIVGEAADGAGAVELTQKLKPDLVLMDLMMPIMDGLTAIEEIMAHAPTPILVLSASLGDRDVNNAFAAIKRGALDVMAKPEGFATETVSRCFASAIIEKVRMLARIKVIRRRPSRSRGVPPSGPKSVEPHRILAIGASTGGPQAVMKIVRSLPADFNASVLIVQHIASGFAYGFAQWLSRESTIPIRLAKDGEEFLPGAALVAPSNCHMVVAGGRIKLTKDQPVNCCRPSIDVLFKSLAQEHGGSVVAILLSGMGKDGAEGLTHIRQRGGMTIAQDEQSCAVFGMPKAAIAMDAVDMVVPLGKIPLTISRLFVSRN